MATLFSLLLAAACVTSTLSHYMVPLYRPFPMMPMPIGFPPHPGMASFGRGLMGPGMAGGYKFTGGAVTSPGLMNGGMLAVPGGMGGQTVITTDSTDINMPYSMVPGSQVISTDSATVATGNGGVVYVGDAPDSHDNSMNYIVG